MSGSTKASSAAAMRGIRKSAGRSASAISSCPSCRPGPRPATRDIFGANGGWRSSARSTWRTITSSCCRSSSTTPTRHTRGYRRSSLPCSGSSCRKANPRRRSTPCVGESHRGRRRILRPRRKTRAGRRSPDARPRALPPPYPPFPREEPGQRMRFWALVLGWMSQCAWAALQRLPRWVRIVIYVWLASVLLSRGCHGIARAAGQLARGHRRHQETQGHRRRVSRQHQSRRHRQIGRADRKRIRRQRWRWRRA